MDLTQKSDGITKSLSMSECNYLFATYATARFLPALQLWLRTTCMHGDYIVNIGKKVTIRVYIGPDIIDSVMESLKTNYIGVEFIRIPKEVPEGSFADYWASEHYAWKLWILHELVYLSMPQNTIGIYFDSGVIMTSMPKKMIEMTIENKNPSFIEDTYNTNDRWCSESFKTIMKATDIELSAYQLQASAAVFMVGSEGSMTFFNEAYKYSKNRDVIAGPKWAGFKDGKPYGHRHDQSIMSILSLRLPTNKVNIDEVQTPISVREAKMKNKAFYIHRGLFKTCVDLFPEVTDAYVINLDKRRDRYETFKENMGDAGKKITRVSAIDGCNLKLTPAIARLLRPNDFFWKKAIAGCALSHLSLWVQLASESPDTKSYMIFEDDAKMKEGWLETWAQAAKTIPKDFDVLYLGGVLPPNRAGFDKVKEHVVGPWYKVAANQVFGQREPTRYFHFCNYAYVISNRGAQKILKIIQERDGFFTSGDHMIVNHWDKLNIYFHDPLIAGCTQESDPAYMNSEFNNFNRIDKFDSDLWTNDERWSLEERDLALKSANTNKLDINMIFDALMDTIKKDSEPAPAPAPAPATVPATTTVNTNMTVYMLNATEKSHDALMEIDWLEELFESKIDIKNLPQTSDGLKEGEQVWVLVNRPHVQTWANIFKIFESEKRQFKVIHLSDEYCLDDISWYNNPMCKGVIRNYYRPECTTNKNVIQIPLGYARGRKATNNDIMRQLVWSFEGTNWFNREELLEPLIHVGPNYCKFYKDWNDKEQSSGEDYCGRLKNSIFVPIPKGNNYETFRLYEALEAGCIPLIVREKGDESYWKWVTSNIPLINVPSYNAAKDVIKFLMSNEEHKNKYCKGIQEKFAVWKESCKKSIKALI